jgi:hypothetical protein
MSLPQPQCVRCQSPVPATGRCARCEPAAALGALAGSLPRSLGPLASDPPGPTRTDDRWDVPPDAPAPARVAAGALPFDDDGPGTLAFGRAEDGSIKPLSREPAVAAPAPAAPEATERHTVGFLNPASTGAFAIPPPQMLSEPPTDVFASLRSAPKVTILGAGRVGAPPSDRPTPSATLTFQRDIAPLSPATFAGPSAPAPPAPRAEPALASTLSFEAKASPPPPAPARVVSAHPALATSIPANDAAAAPTAPPPAVAPAHDAPAFAQVTALAGGAALLVAGLLSAPTGATDTVAFLLAGGALLATTVSEMSSLQRAWSSVAVGLPLLVLEVGANPMLPGLAAALAALVVAALGGALSLRARAPTSPLSRDTLAGTVVAGAAWMIAPGAGGLADPARRGARGLGRAADAPGAARRRRGARARRRAPRVERPPRGARAVVRVAPLPPGARPLAADGAHAAHRRPRARLALRGGRHLPRALRRRRGARRARLSERCSRRGSRFQRGPSAG